MRLFAAIELPDSVVDELQTWWQQAACHFDGDEWRPVSPHLWHMTLAFYGDVGGTDADDLAESLIQCAQSTAPLLLETEGSGFFPGVARPRVFWAGIRDTEAGKRLKNLAHCCRRAGHATVRKRTARESAFRGHITVARSKGFPTPLTMSELALLAEVPPLGWCADRLTLFQSILHADGPQYRRLETFELKGSVYGTRGNNV